MTNQDAWKIYETYVAGWKAISKDERAKILNGIIAPDVHYATPRHETGGRDTIIEDAATFQAKFPGGHFDIGDVSAHHNTALLTWVLIQADGTEFARGHDEIEVANGKITRLVTFAPSVTKP